MMKKSFLLLLMLLSWGVKMQAQAVVQLAPDPKYQFLDASGNPLVGGKLCTYITGTNTPQPTYTDATGMTQNMNPTILDAGGRANVWWDVTKIYRAVLRAAGTTTTCNDGVVQWTVDGIKTTNAQGLLTSNNRWTGQNVWCGKRPWRDVMCYGAVGDSSTDDGPAIQAAIDDACQNTTDGGGDVRFPSPPVNYFVATTIHLESVSSGVNSCTMAHLLGTQGPQGGGFDQFARAPRVKIQGTAIPIFDIDNCLNPPNSVPTGCTVGANVYFTLENLDIVSLSGMGLRTRDVSFLLLKNVGLANFYDAGVPFSAALSLQGSTLWFKAEDSSFANLNDNMGPFNPAPMHNYDPTSWTPASVWIVGNSNSSGSILFDFENVTYSFGGVKLTVEDTASGSCGLTYGEMIFKMNTIEGQFASPLLRFEDNKTGATCGATLTRVTSVESQMSDVAHPTPMFSAKGIDANHTASFGSLFMTHNLAAGCLIQGINSHENIAGIWADEPQLIYYACDEFSVPGISMSLVRHTNTGLDFIAPIAGPTNFAVTTSDTGAVRTFVPDGVHSNDLTASYMLDTDGAQYLGPGGISGFDLKLGRTGTEAWAISTSVPPPTALMLAAGGPATGSFGAGTYFVCVAAGNRNSTPFTVSSCLSNEQSVVLGAADSIVATWVASPTNPNNENTVYVGPAGGGAGSENKAQNVNSMSGATLVAMPFPNQIPNTTGTLLAPVFNFTGNNSIVQGGIEFDTDNGFGNGMAAQPVITTLIGTGGGPTTADTVVNYLKIKIGGADFWIPLMQ